MKIHRRLLPFALLLGVATVSLPSVAHACPVCASDTAQQVRAGLFDSNLGYNLVVMVLPFLVLIVIVALTYYGLPPIPAWFRHSKQAGKSRRHTMSSLRTIEKTN